MLRSPIALLVLVSPLFVACGGGGPDDKKTQSFQFVTDPAGPEVLWSPGLNSIKAIVRDGQNVDGVATVTVSYVGEEVTLTDAGATAAGGGFHMTIADGKGELDLPFDCRAGADNHKVTIGMIPDGWGDASERVLRISCPTDGNTVPTAVDVPGTGYVFYDAETMEGVTASVTDDGIRLDLPDGGAVPTGAHQVVWVNAYDTTDPSWLTECSDDDDAYGTYARDPECVVYDPSTFLTIVREPTESNMVELTLDVPIRAIDTSTLSVTVGDQTGQPDIFTIYYAIRDDTGDLSKFALDVDIPAFAEALSSQ